MVVGVLMSLIVTGIVKMPVVLSKVTFLAFLPLTVICVGFAAIAGISRRYSFLAGVPSPLPVMVMVQEPACGVAAKVMRRWLPMASVVVECRSSSKRV